MKSGPKKKEEFQMNADGDYMTRGSAYREHLQNFYEVMARKALAKKEPMHRLDNLLEGNFFVGEDHENVSPKRFLIENMKALKTAGFTTLFLEHLFYENQQELDTYCKGKSSAKIPTSTAADLSVQDERVNAGKGHEAENQRYNYTELVKAAKAAGIRVVAIDSRYEYLKFSGHTKGEYGVIENRQRAMNHMAFEVIRQEMRARPKEKWIGLVGETHLRELIPGVRGVSELLNAKSVHVKDEPRMEHQSVVACGPMRLELIKSVDGVPTRVQVDQTVDLCISMTPLRPGYLFNRGVAAILAHAPKELKGEVLRTGSPATSDSKEGKSTPDLPPDRAPGVALHGSGPSGSSTPDATPSASLHGVSGVSVAPKRRLPGFSPLVKKTGDVSSRLHPPEYKDPGIAMSGNIAGILRKTTDSATLSAEFDKLILEYAAPRVKSGGPTPSAAYTEALQLFITQLDQVDITPSRRNDIKRELCKHLEVEIGTKPDVTHMLRTEGPGIQRGITCAAAILQKSMPDSPTVRTDDDPSLSTSIKHHAQ
jgi:hypothetical protein